MDAFLIDVFIMQRKYLIRETHKSVMKSLDLGKFFR